jgi:hypothetical protein
MIYKHCLYVKGYTITLQRSQSQSYITTDGQSWCQAPIRGPSLELYYYQLRVCLCVAPSVTRDGSVVNSCYWASPAQTFSGLCPAGIMTVYYCLKFGTHPMWRDRFPYLASQEQGIPVILQALRIIQKTDSTIRWNEWQLHTAQASEGANVYWV